MIKDKAEALAAIEFHKGCFFNIGSRGAIHEYHRIWYKSSTKTWKTRPDEFNITVKHGLRGWDHFTQNELGKEDIYTEKTCPATLARKKYENVMDDRQIDEV